MEQGNIRIYVFIASSSLRNLHLGTYLLVSFPYSDSIFSGAMHVYTDIFLLLSWIMALLKIMGRDSKHSPLFTAVDEENKKCFLKKLGRRPQK